MRRTLGALAATVVGVVWLVTFRVTPLPVDAVSEPAAVASRSPGASGLPTAPARTSAPASSAAGATPNASGTFTGSAVSTIYGQVQVRITVVERKITDVQALALPRDRARSAAISQYAAPMLRTEAIRAQSANIDIVSGATYTSIAYARSLDAALKQAHLG
jgi:uncharacterized protein with FMN-binding domain